MLVKHMIRELMKCPDDYKVEINVCSSGESCYLDINNESKTIWIEGPKKCDYNNTHDTPFPLPEKE